MTITNGYTTLPELDQRLGINDASEAVLREAAIQRASRAIDGFCGRKFWQDGAASARVWYPQCYCPAEVELPWDISETTALVVKEGTDGATWTTVASTDYELEPANGVGPDGNTGWPYWRIRKVAGWFPYPVITRKFTVQVTAKWGWVAVPDPVKEACLILAADLYHLKDNRFGTVGFNEFGPLRVRAAIQAHAAELLEPYRRPEPFFAVA